MTWVEILARVRRILDEETSSVSHWKDAAGDTILTNLAKDGEREFVALTGYFRGTNSQNITAGGTGLYTIPSDCLRIENIMADSTLLDEKNESEVFDYYGDDWTADTGTPIFYIPQGTQIRLVPIPDTAKANGLVISYIDMPAQSTDTPLTPARFHAYFAYYAAAQAFVEDQSQNAKYLIYNNLFLEGVQKATKERRGKNRKTVWRNTLRTSLDNYWNNQ